MYGTARSFTVGSRDSGAIVLRAVEFGGSSFTHIRLGIATAPLTLLRLLLKRSTAVTNEGKGKSRGLEGNQASPAH